MPRRIKRRTRKYSFRNEMMADYYGNAAVRTKFEYLLQGFLEEASIPYLVNQIFCFSCDKFFPYEHNDIPEHCCYCRVGFKNASGGEKGHLSRPDFIINYNRDKKYDSNFIGIIRVDGGVHYAKKSTRISDYHILQAFKKRGIRVFIIPNEMLLAKSVKELREFVENMKMMMFDPELYIDYINSKEYEELTYCPDIEIKRYNKK